ncbi:MAG: acyltransferase [Thermoguttaceae bacterium]
MNAARDYRFDLLRVFACVSILVLHTTSAFLEAPNATVPFFIVAFVNSLCRAAVPLFVMTAGRFALEKIDDFASIPPFLCARARRLWRPTLLWSAIYLALYFADKILRGAPIDFQLVLYDWVWRGKPGAGYHLWYLYMLVGLELIAPPLFLWTRKRPRLLNACSVGVFAAFCAIATSLIQRGGTGRGDLFLPLLCVAYLPYYFLGSQLWRRTRRLDARGRRRLRVLALVLVCAGTAIMLALIYAGRYNDARNEFSQQGLYLALGEYLFFLSLPPSKEGKEPKALGRAAAQSFDVYLSHVAFLALLPRLFGSWGSVFEETPLGAFALACLTYAFSTATASVVDDFRSRIAKGRRAP